jgi:hypothetical protein
MAPYTWIFRFMRQMTTEKLFEEGKYMVIYLIPETVKMDERQFYLWNPEDIATAKAKSQLHRCCFPICLNTRGFFGSKYKSFQPSLKILRYLYSLF